MKRPLAFSLRSLLGAAMICCPLTLAAATSDLVLHLPLERDLHDATGHALTLRHHGVTLRHGAAWFDGQNSEIVLPYQALSRRPFALSMWVKVEGDYPTYGLIEQRAANLRNQHFHVQIREHKPYFGFYVNDLRGTTQVTAASGWTHLVFQYENGEQSIWVNGERTATRRARSFLGRSGEFAIGRTPRWTNVPARDFVGGLRDLRLYSHPLASSEIASLYQAGALESARIDRLERADRQNLAVTQRAAIGFVRTNASLLKSGPRQSALGGDKDEVRDKSGEPALLNLSTRARVHAGEAIVTGFVVGGATERRVLFRAIGPTLEHFGINDGLARPRLEVYSDDGTRAGEFMTWGGDDKLAEVFASVGAFALPRASNDAAAILNLPPGAYTVVLKGATATDEGEVLLEVYSVN